MNANAIYSKYADALAIVGAGASSPSRDAVLLALRLAIIEATESNIPESAFVAVQKEMAVLRQHRDSLVDVQEDLDSAHKELFHLIAERDGLRQQLAQLDADNADLTRKLAIANSSVLTVANSRAVIAATDPILVHTNGAAPTPTPEPALFNWTGAITPELADYWESLDKGRRSFRQLDKRIRLALVQVVLKTLDYRNDEPITQAIFNAQKPEWMPMATSLCSGFGCAWGELATLDPMEVAL